MEVPPVPEGNFLRVEAYAYHEDYLAERRDLYGAQTLELIMGGAEVSASEYAVARAQLALGRKAIAKMFDDVDILVTPTLVGLPISIQEALEAPFEATRILARNTSPFNFYGIPTVSVPCGFSREGLPIGLQITGRPLGELDVIALAHAYQQATDWHERKPRLS